MGKTQLASRIIRGEFRERSLPTVGMEFGTRSLRYAEHSSVRAQVGGGPGAWLIYFGKLESLVPQVLTLGQATPLL